MERCGCNVELSFTMKTKYFCDICGQSFDTEKECLEHERKCSKVADKLLTSLDKLCGEFVECVRQAWLSKFQLLEKSKDAEGLVRFLDYDLSVVGIKEEFKVMSSDEFHESLFKNDKTVRNDTIKFVIDLVGQSLMLEYIEKFKDIYSDASLDRSRLSDESETISTLVMLIWRTIFP